MTSCGNNNQSNGTYRRSFFFNDTATTEIYTLSLHDALPISTARSPSTACSTARPGKGRIATRSRAAPGSTAVRAGRSSRSEEHTSELQSRQYLVCRLLLEKKKNLFNRELVDHSVLVVDLLRL